MDFGNVFRGFVPTAMTLDQQNEEKRRWEVQEARNKAIFGRQEKDWARQDEIDRKLQEANDWYAQGMDAIKTGKIGEFAPSAVEYLNNTDYNGKARGAYLQGADGKHYVAYHAGEDGPPQMMEITPQMAQQSLQEMYRHKLASADQRQSLANLDKDRQFGLEKEKVGIQRQEAADKGQYYRDVGEYHRGVLNKPITGNDGSGRLIALSPDGTRLIGEYGERRPLPGGGVGKNHFIPLTGGYMFDQLGGGYYDAAGKRITDNATIEKINKMGTPANVKPDVTVEVPTPDGKGMAKVTMPYADAVARGHIQEAIPVQSRRGPPPAAPDYVQYLDDPVTARTMIPKAALEEYARGRGLPLWNSAGRTDAARRALGLPTAIMPKDNSFNW